MSKVRRFDRGGLRSPERMANGWLRVDGYIARAGILEYKRADGTAWREYRPPEENSSPDTLESFAMVPLTNDHPREGLLDAENTKLYQVGTVERPSMDGDTTRASILVTDAATIKAIENGKVELSCGYLCDLDFTPGEVDGQRYDAIQRAVRGNHVAVVKEGRAGPEVRLRVDSADAEVVGFDKVPETAEVLMTKISLDGVEFEVAESAAQAVTKALEAKAAEIEKLAARADAAEASAKKLQEELQAAPEKIRAEIAARVALETSAKSVLGEEKFDGKSDLDVKKAVAEKVLGMKFDGKSDAYVDASFEIALKAHADSAETGLSKARTAAVPDTRVDSAEDARAKFYAASRNAHLRK